MNFTSIIGEIHPIPGKNLAKKSVCECGSENKESESLRSWDKVLDLNSSVPEEY